MGLTYTELKITNVFNRQSVTVRALVDTGAISMCVTPEIARQLGFDVEEMPKQLVTVADGRQVEAPCIGPIKLEFANRDCHADALVLGNEPLMGVLALEAMDLVIDPSNQQVMVNPAHPNRAVFPVKNVA